MAIGRDANTARRPRRNRAVTYRIRADLQDADPPIWRLLELRSDLFLNEVHDIIQVAFGWTDSHLHGFASGGGFFDRDADRYLCPFDVDEGEVGVPEQQVRLDEVLVSVGDHLGYVYDYGDNWMLTIVLEAVLPSGPDGLSAMCIDGSGAGPPDDSGGVFWHQQTFVAASDPDHPYHDDAVERLAWFGDGFDPEAFDASAVNADLAGRARGLRRSIVAERAGVALGPIPTQVADLIDSSVARGAEMLLELARLARLDAPVDVDDATATRMVGHYTWLLEHIGDEGIRLTSAGYLPPLDVSAVAAQLDLANEWIGTLNREAQTDPVLEFRETARALGLVRKYRGRLKLTKLGAALRADPVRLWWHIAERLPTSKDPFEVQADLVLMLMCAAGPRTTSELDSGSARYDVERQQRTKLAVILDSLGWSYADGRRLGDEPIFSVGQDITTVFTRLGCYARTRHRWSTAPTADGATFARAALTSRPS
ncbi:MAG TPA: plasmid pRiA4b ORF-3 family protein, partial [Jiangellaceae bacterium]|nr:plasmid pRiA4b ORF-3 family protein [Jiangellaceae bacterium]